MISGGTPPALHWCWQVLQAAALSGYLGLGLPSWAAALGLSGWLGPGLHGGYCRFWRLPWQRLAPRLGVWVDLHLLHKIVRGCSLPLKHLGCVPHNCRWCLQCTQVYQSPWSLGPNYRGLRVWCTGLIHWCGCVCIQWSASWVTHLATVVSGDPLTWWNYQLGCCLVVVVWLGHGSDKLELY